MGLLLGLCGVPGWGHSLGLGLVQALVGDGHYLLQNVPDVLLPSASRDPPATPTRVSATGRLARAPRLSTHQSQAPPAPAWRGRPQQPLVHSWGGGPEAPSLLRPSPAWLLPPPNSLGPLLPPPQPPPVNPLPDSPGVSPRPLRETWGTGWTPHRRPRPPAAEKMEPERERRPKRGCVRERGRREEGEGGSDEGRLGEGSQRGRGGEKRGGTGRS